MKPFVAQLKRLGTSAWNVTKAIGELLVLVFELILTPISWIMRLLD